MNISLVSFPLSQKWKRVSKRRIMVLMYCLHDFVECNLFFLLLNCPSFLCFAHIYLRVLCILQLFQKILTSAFTRFYAATTIFFYESQTRISSWFIYFRHSVMNYWLYIYIYTLLVLSFSFTNKSLCFNSKNNGRRERERKKWKANFFIIKT